MAGVIEYRSDLVNRRAFAMWSDGERQFRTNILLDVGATIPLHAHSYAHDVEVGGGVFDVAVISPDGAETRKRMEDGDRDHIPAWWRHQFTLIAGGPGKVECSWALGSDA